MKLLFVCLGNICRSPAAEAVFEAKLKKAGLDSMVECDSAATSSYTAGRPPDERMKVAALARGYETSGKARQIIFPDDFQEFDLILTMDNSNYENVLALDSQTKYRGKVKKLTDFCQKNRVSEVPDPYYHGEERFNLVLDILDDATDGLLSFVKEGLE
jgi:protein-tyrosine phosphatase